METEYTLCRDDGTDVDLLVEGDVDEYNPGGPHEPPSGGFADVRSAVCERGVDWLPLLTPAEVARLEGALLRQAEDDAENNAVWAAEARWEASEDR